MRRESVSGRWIDRVGAVLAVRGSWLRAGFSLVLLGVATQLGCASDQASLDVEVDRVSPSPAEPDLPSPIDVAAPDGSYWTRAAVRSALWQTNDEGRDYVNLDIGAAATVSCWFMNEAPTLSGSLNHFSELFFATIQEDETPVARQIHRVDAGAIGPAHFMELDWRFRVDGSAGLLRTAIANKDGWGIVCHHVGGEEGEPFERLFRQVVSGFESRDPSPDALPPTYFREISVAILGDMTVGVQSASFSHDEEGDTRIQVDSSTLMPVGPAELMSQQTYSVEWSQSDGVLINAYVAKWSGAEIDTELSLERAGDAGKWMVSGLFQSKGLEVELQSSSPPLSTLGEYLVVQRKLAPQGAHQEVSIQRWVFDADPTQFLTSTVRLLEELPDQRSRIEIQLDEFLLKAERDSRGIIESSRIPAGGAEMVIQRVYIDGSI